MTNDRHHRQNLALIGLRGTGKSSVGRILAERLGWSFLDADVELEARVGRPIPEIFAQDGETAFRDWEEQILEEITGRSRIVLATGGGVVLRDANRRRLQSFGSVIWLEAALDEIAGRLRADARGLAARPALTASGTLAELADLLQARAPIYRSIADAVVDTTGKTVAEVADAVVLAWPGRPQGFPE